MLSGDDKIASPAATTPAAQYGVFARHDLCWLQQGASEFGAGSTIRSIDGRSPRIAEETDGAQDAVRGWIAARRPLIVTRQCADREPGRRQLAMCGPRMMVPRRVAVGVSADDIGAVTPALPLESTIHAAPLRWQPGLRALDLALAELDLTARVFGSLAWQALTGLAYLHAGSDVDLIVDLSADAWRAAFTPEGRWDDGVEKLMSLVDAAPFRCDCELRLDRDAACSLAELRGESTQVLLKRNDRSLLVARQALWELAS